MKSLVWLAVLLSVPHSCFAQENPGFRLTVLSPYYSEPRTRTDVVWAISKPLGFVVGHADAYTTAQQIKRGYVEANAFDNLVIPSNSPALFGRSALLHAENYGINLILQYAYGKCGTSRLCKWTVIGARGYFTGRGIANIVHNARLP